MDDNAPMPKSLESHEPGARLSRRQVLQILGVGAASSWIPGCRRIEAPPVPHAGPLPTFFTAEERVQLAALADYVLPPDDAPGGAALGAVAYIENLLTCLDDPFPGMFLGGPYSGRQPFPNADGTPSTRFPAKDFYTYRPPSRVALKAWQLYRRRAERCGGGAG
jgi:hypothetical protein